MEIIPVKSFIQFITESYDDSVKGRSRAMRHFGTIHSNERPRAGDYEDHKKYLYDKIKYNTKKTKYHEAERNKHPVESEDWWFHDYLRHWHDENRDEAESDLGVWRADDE